MQIKSLALAPFLAVAFLVQSAVAIPTNNLALWLKANAGVEEATADTAENNDFISAWRDQSGNMFDAFPMGIGGNSVTLYKPTFVTNGINNKPAVLFGLGPGNQEYSRLQLLTPLLTGTADFHIFAVVKFGTVNPGGEKIIGSNYGLTNSSGIEYYGYLNKQTVFKAGSVSGTNVVVDGVAHLFEARRVGSTISLWFDNVLDGSGSLPSAIGGNINWTLGNGGDYSSGGNMGYIAEEIVYNNSLSSNDIHLVVRHLADAYNLAVVPEPTAIILACFGASMLLFRRR